MEIKALVSQMTLEEKAGLCSGLDFGIPNPSSVWEFPP